jgi:8-oxo-dGTP pyrophosphatase MutT (NUDIX family)
VSALLRVSVVDVFAVSIAPRSNAWRVLALRRASGVRCPGSWETVHGKILRRESPEEAAVRELREETGLVAKRLYNVTTHGFYLHQTTSVEIAVVFCAFVGASPRVRLGEEHDSSVWLTRAAAMKRFAWPRERECLGIAYDLLSKGHAGPVDDVLRVPLPTPR